MNNTQTFESLVSPDNLLPLTARMKADGYRLTQMSANRAGGLELIYSFTKGYNLVNYRLPLEEDTEVESISGVYSYAYIYENEIKDLFGIKILHINLDFSGHFYKTAVKTPYAPSVDTPDRIHNQDLPKEEV